MRRLGEMMPTPYNRLRKMKIYGVANFGREDFRYWRRTKKERLTMTQRRVMSLEAGSLAYKPLISVVTPVYNVAREWLEEALDSVLGQIYPHWELCLADDASTAPHIRPTLEKYLRRDERVRAVFLDRNQGIAGSSNQALALAKGEYVAFLDHDDVLAPDALFQAALLLRDHPDADVIYSDEDKLTMSGLRLRPVLKTGWDPQLMLSYNYLCHLVICRRSLVEQAGGFRPGFDGSQDYDLLLRVTELTGKIYHIPKVLYHWRMIPGSTAAVMDAKREALGRSGAALREALQRRGVSGTIAPGDAPGTFKIIFPEHFGNERCGSGPRSGE